MNPRLVHYGKDPSDLQMHKAHRNSRTTHGLQREVAIPNLFSRILPVESRHGERVPKGFMAWPSAYSTRRRRRETPIDVIFSIGNKPPCSFP
jgi:hypothetical protein